MKQTKTKKDKTKQKTKTKKAKKQKQKQKQKTKMKTKTKNNRRLAVKVNVIKAIANFLVNARRFNKRYCNYLRIFLVKAKGYAFVFEQLLRLPAKDNYIT